MEAEIHETERKRNENPSRPEQYEALSGRERTAGGLLKGIPQYHPDNFAK
jgi:hypothetical protein